MQIIKIINSTRPECIPIRAENCQSFLSRFRGLMFRDTIKTDEGLLLTEVSESRINTSIHMLFMKFDIAAIWINNNFQVVDAKLAKKWKLAYLPSQPARYTLEIHPSRLHDFQIGDQLIFEDL